MFFWSTAIKPQLKLCATLLTLAATLPCAAAEDAQLQLPDVVVTSQKIAQTLEEVPASVSTVDADTIRSSGAHSLTDMQDYIPNVSIAQNHTAATFAIRGFATPDTNPGFDPSVGAVVDGVYYGRSQFLTAFFHDMDRIEVLRGPQGTLFGKNSTAGVLSIVTQAPGSENLAIAEVQYTSFSEYSLQPVLQVALGPEFAVRVSGDYRHGSKGVLHNTFLNRPENNPESNTTRLRARYSPDSLITFDFEAFTSHEVFNNNAFQNSALTLRMRQALSVYDPNIDSNIDRNNSQSFPSLSDGLIRGLSSTLTFNIDGQMGVPDLKVLTIVGLANSITDKKELDADFSPIDFLDNTQAAPSFYKQLTDEIRLVGQGEKIFGYGHGYNFVTGFFLSSNSFRDSGIYRVEDLGGAAAYCNATSNFCGVPVPIGGIIPSDDGSNLGQTIGPVLTEFTRLAGAGDQTALLNLDQHGRSWAFFGQFESFLLEHWALIGGLRYGDEIKDGFASSHSTSQLVKAITSQKDHDSPLHLEERDVSPKAGFKWEPNKRLAAYVTWSRGYKSGGFNALPLAPTNLQYKAERAESVEIGSKGIVDFLGGPMRLSAAIYNTTFDNLQVSAFLGGNFVVLNAAAARSRGLDFDFHWLTPVQGFTLTGAYGLADARYTSYPCAPATAGNTVPNPACDPNNPTDTSTQNLGGKRLSFAPRWTASLIPAYQVPFDAAITTLSLDLVYRGSRYLDVDLDPAKLQPGTRVYNGRFTIASPSRAWSANLVAHNLTNVVFADQAISQPLAPGNVLIYRTDFGRYYSANITLQF